MSWMTDRLPVSRLNAMFIAALLVGAAVTFAVGQILQGLGLLAISIGGLCGALIARRPQARDVTRLNAVEWRDERDRRLGKDALSVVGATALTASIIELVVTSILGADVALWIAYAQAMALNLIWGIANSLAVRRG